MKSHKAEPNIQQSGARVNFRQQDTYRFVDDKGKTMKYSVSYGEGRSSKGIDYVKDVEFCECEASDPDDYESLCNYEAMTKRFSDLPKDLKVRKVNRFLTTVVAIGLSIPLLALLLSILEP